MDVSPDPNAGTPGQIDNNFVSVPITRNRTDQFDVRVDHNLSSQFNLFGRYSFSDTNLFQPSFRPGLSEGSRNDTFGSALWRSQAVAVGGTWVLSSTLVSEMRFGFARGNFFQTPPNFGSGCPEQLIGLKGAADGREHLRRHSGDPTDHCDRTPHRSHHIGAAVSNAALL